MRLPTLIKCSVSLVCFAFLPAGPAASSDATDQVHGAMLLTPGTTSDAAAAGAVSDTLKACLARIPNVATSGQRMLAEQNCKGEDATRKAITLAPKF